MTKTSRNALITKNRKWNRWPLYPCWCGESLVDGYRRTMPCCDRYLHSLAVPQVRIVLAEL